MSVVNNTSAGPLLEVVQPSKSSPTTPATSSVDSLSLSSASKKSLASTRTLIECGSVDTKTIIPARLENDYLYADYTHTYTSVERHVQDGVPSFQAIPHSQLWRFRTRMEVAKTGLLLVGIGGNNGTTFAAGMFANRRGVHWEDLNGSQQADWLGSIAMCGTMKLGIETSTGRDIFVPVRSILPMLHPDDIVLGGWDISGLSMPAALSRARVLPLEVQRQVEPDLAKIQVWPGIYRPDFIATNQCLRADNILEVGKDQSLWSQYEAVRANIRDFKKSHELDKVIVLWTANTERFAEHLIGVHDTPSNFLQAIQNNHSEIAPSALYAAAAIMEGCSYINGSPQNTFCEALVTMALVHGTYLIGDDLKTGQTKMKSVMADLLVNSALKPTSIVSYNHLGNNDGLNLSSERQFRSKEVTKASVVDDMIASNAILYPPQELNHEFSTPLDHLIVIKYVPAVGDSKRALDEYCAKIFMNGTQTIVMHNTCEDSLLAAPIILDLVIFCELLERITIQKDGTDSSYSELHPLGSILSLFLKAPQVREGVPVINALFPQREALFSFIRAAAGLPPIDHLTLAHRVKSE